MATKSALVVLDFDGFLINSYDLLRATFESFGLNIGDERRFKDRRKFLKYLGGGKELLGNLVSYSLPKRKKLRASLTEHYVHSGRIFPVFESILNRMIASPQVHVGIVSRNFTLNPGATMRAVLKNSGVEEHELDFVIPIPVGQRKHEVLEAMRSRRYRRCLFGGDEIGDFRAAMDSGYEPIIAAYGFDALKRLRDKGGIPPEMIFETPELLVGHLASRLAGMLDE
jgi:phosphoglycolate phosphatase-like HAD superfamily hydrolase